MKGSIMTTLPQNQDDYNKLFDIKETEEAEETTDKQNNLFLTFMHYSSLKIAFKLFKILILLNVFSFFFILMIFMILFIFGVNLFPSSFMK
jgi:hypothetical protein